MKLGRKFLIVVSSLLMISGLFLFSACGKEESGDEKGMGTQFPLDDKGYPKKDVLIINNESYPIDLIGSSHVDSKFDSELVVKMKGESGRLEVALPQALPINYWSIDEGKFIDLLSYRKVDFPIKDEDMTEGDSNTVQKFIFQVDKDGDDQVLLKWSNIDEMEKPFKDKKEDYLLKIKVSFEA